MSVEIRHAAAGRRSATRLAAEWTPDGRMCLRKCAALPAAGAG